MEAGSGSERLMYTPHLKEVLKSYQASATKSLHGPNSVMGVWPVSATDERSVSSPNPACAVTPSDLTKRSESSSSKKAKSSSSSQPGPSGNNKDSLQEFDPFIAPPPFPIQQPPIFTPADQTRCEKSETVLESETIACFNVGGEERLCLPQLFNSVLRAFSLQQINIVCDTLHIYCSRCNQDQLEVLKASGILPWNAPSCGLITKTDAQRLCAALLDTNPLIVTKAANMKPPFQIQIYHECFGRCSGLYTPEMFHAVHAPCIECVECHALLSPEKFVCHVHHPKETRTCHWGFDVHKWRAYILLEVGLEENVELQEALKDMKERFGAKFKRKQILEENFEPPQKRVHVDNSYYPSYPYAVDPMLVYYYNANSHLWDKAFQSYPVITKDGKTLCFPPDIPHLIHKSMNVKNRLALTPANVQKLMPMKLSEETSLYAYHKASSRQLKKDAEDSIPCFDSEDVHSDSSFSTISAGTEDGLMSNFDDEDELLPNPETELVEIKKAMTDIDSSVSTKILSEVETIIAKYRKCLHCSLQGKKLHYMELEKKASRQRSKIRKLEEKKLSLERELQKLKSDSSTSVNEQSESRQTEVATPDPLQSSQPLGDSEKDSSALEDNTTTTTTTTEDKNPEIPFEEGDTQEIVRLESDETLPASSPSLPKQSPNLEAEPLGK